MAHIFLRYLPMTMTCLPSSSTTRRISRALWSYSMAPLDDHADTVSRSTATLIVTFSLLFTGNYEGPAATVSVINSRYVLHPIQTSRSPPYRPFVTTVASSTKIPSPKSIIMASICQRRLQHASRSADAPRRGHACAITTAFRSVLTSAPSHWTFESVFHERMGGEVYH